MTQPPLPVAIIGLGKVGSRFDEEPGRTAVWSHAGAYLARPHLFRLVGAVEPFAANAEAFARRCPGVPLFADVREMLPTVRPAVVSICTPQDSHAPMVLAAAQSPGVRVIWCEKPLAADEAGATQIIDSCDRAGVKLVVSHVRRWMPLWRRARMLLSEAAVGRVHVVRIAFPNRLFSMGSHAIDLLQYLGGPLGSPVSLGLPALREGGEPAAAALFPLSDGAYGILQVCGPKANLVVEAEVVGSDGRITVREDRNTITIERFVPHRQYVDYREFGAQTVETVAVPGEFSPFVAVADEIAALIDGSLGQATCDGVAARAVQSAIAQLVG